MSVSDSQSEIDKLKKNKNVKLNKDKIEMYNINN